MAHFQKTRPGLRQDENLDEIATCDRRNQHQDDRFDLPHPESLKRQQQQHVAGGDDHGPENRDVEEQIDRNRAAQHFGQIAGADGQFA